jgi:hypothetical protein
VIDRQRLEAMRGSRADEQFSEEYRAILSQMEKLISKYKGKLDDSRAREMLVVLEKTANHLYRADAP